MTADELRAWQARMGYSYTSAAAALGVSKATYADWATGKSRTTGQAVAISRTVALACAALEAGLPPIGRETTNKILATYSI